MTKAELFVKLAEPDEKGESRWVYSTEFVGEYAALKLGNGGSWSRPASTLAKKYRIELDKSLTRGNSIDAVRLVGFNDKVQFNCGIRDDIRRYYERERCVMLGVCGSSENTKIEIDHKDGRKENERVSNKDTQHLSDFQPLCKAANDVKRQICKTCRSSNKRWDARNIKGNPFSFYEGSELYDETLGVSRLLPI